MKKVENSGPTFVNFADIMWRVFIDCKTTSDVIITFSFYKKSDFFCPECFNRGEYPPS